VKAPVDEAAKKGGGQREITEKIGYLGKYRPLPARDNRKNRLSRAIQTQTSPR